jgi:hypothetical protein
LPGILRPGDIFDIPDGITVSEPRAPLMSASLVLYKDDELVEWLEVGEYRETATSLYASYGWFCYAYHDCNIKGDYFDEEDEITVTYDVNLKKGWNWLFQIYKQDENGISGDIVTKVPSGAAFYYPGTLYPEDF